METDKKLRQFNTNLPVCNFYVFCNKTEENKLEMKMLQAELRIKEEYFQFSSIRDFEEFAFLIKRENKFKIKLWIMKIDVLYLW